LIDALVLVTQLGLVILLSWWVVRRDFARLGPRELERTWNQASFWSALVFFAPFCIPVHFVRARRSLAGLGLGVVWMVGVTLTAGLGSAGVEALLRLAVGQR